MPKGGFFPLERKPKPASTGPSYRPRGDRLSHLPPIKRCVTASGSSPFPRVSFTGMCGLYLHVPEPSANPSRVFPRIRGTAHLPTL